jgi:23S rRNA pseudouridine1911/1915/1917 synthase
MSPSHASAEAEPLPGAAAEPMEAAEPDEAAHEWREGIVDADGHAQRLDKVLVGMAPEFSRSHLQGLVADGHVRVDGQPVTVPARKLRVGQRVRVELVPTAQSLAFRPEPMALAIVYEDEHLLVVDKPAGLVVHPAAGNWSGTLLNGLLAHHADAARLPRAGIVHRLDKDTTGLMVVAKTLQAMTALVRSIAARDVRREYLALAHGAAPWAHISIDAPIGRDPVSRVRMAVVAGGKPARTDVERLAVRDNVTALRCRLHTGRTHQIRVHLAHQGLPLVGDAVYGGRPLLGMQRQALHAAELAFDHPGDGRPVAFHSALPTDLAQAWQQIVDS